MTEHYSIVRQIKKMPQAIPGQIIDSVSRDQKRDERDQLHTLQQEYFTKNEIAAKKLVEQLPKDATFIIKRRCEEEPCGEISYEVSIKSRGEKNLIFESTSPNIIESTSYVGFCLQTGLMKHDSEGSLTYTSLPQTRQTAA